MINYKWYNGKVPKDIEIKQVYGIVFNEEGNIFLRIDDGLIKNIHLLGYQLVNENNEVKPYAQVRMIAQIDKIFENRPDLDNGKLYERVFKTPKETIDLLNWGEVGRKQIEEAVKLAKKENMIRIE